MSANGSRVFMSPVVQGKNQSNIMNDMKNRNVSNNKSVPVTGFSFNGGSFLSGNSKESASQDPTEQSVIGIGGNATFS